MNRIGKCLAAALVFSLLASSAAHGESVEAVIKKLHDQLAKYKSLSFKSHGTTVIEMPGMSAKTESDQVVEAARQGEKILSRIEMKSMTIQKAGDQEQKIPTTMTIVVDGQYQHTYSESAGQKNATRQKINPDTEFNPFDVQRMFKLMEKDFTIKILHDQTIDGKSCYVVEMSPKNQSAQTGMNIGKQISYFDKASGVSVKSVGYDKDGKTMSTSLTTDVKIDPSLSPERFKFKAPAGVSRIPNAAASPSADEFAHALGDIRRG
jgi:outer membrane lipoprotein-sorting protein